MCRQGQNKKYTVNTSEKWKPERKHKYRYNSKLEKSNVRNRWLKANGDREKERIAVE